ncbi:MAG: hypothetical protein QOI47_2635 [Actinomycetota bacterium]|jgi:hypothetical protein|nr:hypothetical protein [Actinomycetota bacterium]
MAAMPALRRLALVLGAALLAAGCSGSGYSYLANKNEKLYFKVPDSWTVFETNDMTKTTGMSAAGTWVRGFAAGAKPTIGTVLSITSRQPRGYVEVVKLDPTERDALSIATLRGTNFGSDSTGNPIDPIDFVQKNPSGPLQILAYDDGVVLPAGPHGVHIRVAISDTNGEAIIDQTVLVDKATTKRYVLSIGCNPACWAANQRQIKEVIKSWTLEAK